MNAARKPLALGVIAVLVCPSLLVPASAQQPDTVFHAETEIVLVNVTVKDKHGNFARNLKAEDFTVLEDNNPQKILSFDTENIDAVPIQDVTQTQPLENLRIPGNANLRASPASAALEYKDRR